MTPNTVSGDTLLLGLGNPILGDDGVGCAVAELVGRMLENMEGLTIMTASVSPVRLVDIVTGFRRLIVVDSVTTGEHPPGTLMEIEFLRESPFPSSVHHFSIGQIPEISNALGLPCPETIRVYGIEIEPPCFYTDRLSPAIGSRLPSIARELVDLEFHDMKDGHSNETSRGELAV